MKEGYGSHCIRCYFVWFCDYCCYCRHTGCKLRRRCVIGRLCDRMLAPSLKLRRIRPCSPVERSMWFIVFVMLSLTARVTHVWSFAGDRLCSFLWQLLPASAAFNRARTDTPRGIAFSITPTALLTVTTKSLG